ncbi:MAG: helicase HerA-like domain-containing protein [Saprospiraceae bacterium]
MADNLEPFKSSIQSGYSFKGDTIILGSSVLDKQVIKDSFVRLPLKMMNRHGLIAGATGTGKTKSLQLIAENLSAHGVPSLLMDIKGDLSGIALPGESSTRVIERSDLIGLPFLSSGNPVEFLSLSKEKGIQLRATVTEFGPILFSKILNLNDTQSGVISLIFKYCDDQKLPLLDLEDIKKVLTFLSNEGKADIEKEYGRISTASVGTIIRNIIELEQQGASQFFGERSFDVDDLLRVDEKGRGMISILRLTDLQDKPKLFSTFMLQILAEIYSTFPEAGDLNKPKLCLFIDEAHLIFDEASKTLLDQIETIVKLVRSKGVGIYFVTQNPVDVPASVLSQLGLKIQHALRAFTAGDRKSIKQAAQNYPESEFYDVDQLITELGIGEAFVTGLNENGVPTPLVHVMMRPPASRMDILTSDELDHIVSKSDLVPVYNEVINRESAYEILSGKVDQANSDEHNDRIQKQREAEGHTGKSVFEKVMDSTVTRQVGRTVARELTRGLLGVLGIKTTTRRKKTGIFGF